MDSGVDGTNSGTRCLRASRPSKLAAVGDERIGASKSDCLVLDITGEGAFARRRPQALRSELNESAESSSSLGTNLAATVDWRATAIALGTEATMRQAAARAPATVCERATRTAIHLGAVANMKHDVLDNTVEQRARGRGHDNLATLA